MTGMLLAAGLAPAIAQFATLAQGDIQPALEPAAQVIAASAAVAPLAQAAGPDFESPPPLMPAMATSFDIEKVAPTPARWDASAPQVTFEAGGGNGGGETPLVRGIPPKDYGFGTLIDHAGASWLEAGGVFTALTVAGIFDWDWGSSGFHFKSEGWFGRNTANGGMDKLGHAYSGYLITELLSSAIRRKSDRPAGNAISAGILAMGLMTYVEIFDGIAEDHGFSWEDMVADTAGVLFSILRSHVPGMENKLDFRLQYIPSGNQNGIHPLTDNSGQRYILALQLGGFEGLKESPVRFVELHAGYFARGFTAKEQAKGDEKRRVPFFGVGLNLQELLFPHPKRRWQRVGHKALDYIQVPYTAIYSDQLSKD